MSAFGRTERRLPCPAVNRALQIKGQCPSLGRLSKALLDFSEFHERSGAAGAGRYSSCSRFLWWGPMQRWALGIDELERRIEALERKR